MSVATEQQALQTFTEKSYFDYSMYVILDRALAHLADGFKPVQRRIIYAMSELGLKASAKHKKSARTVGDVLGKFHPHGDSACYEAMVLMAQAFSYRYPLIDGQGNWGSPDDPKSFAAMRYTEAKLSPYAELLLSELPQGTVPWMDNFDATLQEPTLLPARLPNILLNGSTGIAVGMSSDILPHNLHEVVDTCVHLLDHPEASLDELMTFLPGPDFPTRAEIITPPHMIRQLYETGIGSIKMRAIYHLEQHHIVLTALPYQVSGSKIIEQIASQMQQKKLPMIEDIRDESDHEHPTRLVIIPKSSRLDVETLMSHLFATTDLEKSHRANFNMIGLDGKPRVKPLLELLKEWLSFRVSTVRNRLTHRLNHVQHQLHILDGLWVAYLNVDEVIRIIREEEDPKAIFMTQFQLTALQADAILDLKLRHLAKLEEMKIQSERNDLNHEQTHIHQLLNDQTQLHKLIKTELLHDRARYGDPRQSPIVMRLEAQALKEQDILPHEPLTIILSEKGWIRCAKGADVQGPSLSYKTGDSFKTQTTGKTNQTVIFMDQEGKVYSLPAHTLPSARGQGEPLTGRLNPNDGVHFETLLCGEPDEWALITTDIGYGFMTPLKTLYVKNKNGKSCLNLPSYARIMPFISIASRETSWIACVSNVGRLLIFESKDMPILQRGKGSRFMQIPTTHAKNRTEWVTALCVFTDQDTLICHAGKRHLSLKPEDRTPYIGQRGQRGHKLPRGFQQIQALSVKTPGST